MAHVPALSAFTDLPVQYFPFIQPLDCIVMCFDVNRILDSGYRFGSSRKTRIGFLAFWQRFFCLCLLTSYWDALLPPQSGEDLLDLQWGLSIPLSFLAKKRTLLDKTWSYTAGIPVYTAAETSTTPRLRSAVRQFFGRPPGRSVGHALFSRTLLRVRRILSGAKQVVSM